MNGMIIQADKENAAEICSMEAIAGSVLNSREASKWVARAGAVVAVGILAAACSGGGGGEDASDSVPTTEDGVEQPVDSSEFCGDGDNKLPLRSETFADGDSINAFPFAFGEDLGALTSAEEEDARSFYRTGASTNNFTASAVAVLQTRIDQNVFPADLANAIQDVVIAAEADEATAGLTCDAAVDALEVAGFFNMGGNVSEVVPVFDGEGNWIATSLVPVRLEDGLTVLGAEDSNGLTYGVDGLRNLYVVFGDGSGNQEVVISDKATDLVEADLEDGEAPDASTDKPEDDSDDPEDTTDDPEEITEQPEDNTDTDSDDETDTTDPNPGIPTGTTPVGTTPVGTTPVGTTPTTGGGGGTTPGSTTPGTTPGSTTPGTTPGSTTPGTTPGSTTPGTTPPASTTPPPPASTTPPPPASTTPPPPESTTPPPETIKPDPDCDPVTDVCD